MSEESKIRSEIVAALHGVQAFPVENTAHVGCPDVCCLLGWIEIKLADRPARADSRVSVVVRPAQRIWMRNWWRQRGLCWWLTRIRGGPLQDIWMIHAGDDGADHLGRDWTTNQMIDRAIWCRFSNENPSDLILGALMRATQRRRS